MSSVIESVEVKGFWGNHALSFALHQDINFLIGVNGSGKTTLIRLVAAALSADFVTLDRIEFSSIEIKLRRASPYAKPLVKVVKEFDAQIKAYDIVYYLYPLSSEAPEKYSLSDVLPYRYRRDPRYYSKLKARALTGRNPIEIRLQEFSSLTWLAVHRSALDDDENRSSDNALDRRLNSLQRELSGYVSALQQRAARETDSFQQSILLSLISRRTDRTLLRDVTRLDVENEKQSLSDAFEELGVERKRSADRIHKHFSQLAKSLKRLKENESLLLSDIFTIVNTWGIHQIASEWHKLSESKEEIFQPKITFLDTLNTFFQRKTLFFDEKNHLYAVTQSGKTLAISDLSSGEKQLLILLGEALLQGQRTSIYIADEPELSLHVQWQEKLVSALVNINPNAQILFATHSPDIVGPYQNRIFDMEAIVQ